MTEAETFSIGEMARRAGLSVRALRHYEEEGLLQPPRTKAGRRIYRAAEILLLMRIILLRKAGFSIARIREVMTASQLDAAGVIDEQLASLENQRETLERSAAMLKAARSKIESSGAVDAASLCDLIKIGEMAVQNEQWQKIYDRYYTEEEQDKWRNVKSKWMQGGDCDSYGLAWIDLVARIKQALPLDPASHKAQQFLAEWNKLLQPFEKNLTPQMREDARRFWRNIDDWHGEVDQPVSPEVVKFITAAKAAAGDRGLSEILEKKQEQ